MTPNDFEAGYLAARVEQQVIIDEQVRKIDKMENELAKAQMLIARQDRQIQQLKKALAATKETK
jgi:hypothetical protein